MTKLAVAGVCFGIGMLVAIIVDLRRELDTHREIIEALIAFTGTQAALNGEYEKAVQCCYEGGSTCKKSYYFQKLETSQDGSAYLWSSHRHFSAHTDGTSLYQSSGF